MTQDQPKPCGERDSIRCTNCEFVQFIPRSGNCRRCGVTLRRSSIEAITVTIVAAPISDAPAKILPMRELMQMAVVAAVRSTGATTKAAHALGVSHARVKQLLRESGDDTDYRKCRPRAVRKRRLRAVS